MGEQPIPEGYCQCGCGGRTSKITVNNKNKGLVAGQYFRYLRAHHFRKRQHAAPGFKYCGRCHTVKPESEFYKDRKRPDGLADRCKACNLQLTLEFREKHPGYQRLAQFYYRVKKEFGLTPDQYRAMYEAQQGLCAICGSPEAARSEKGGNKVLCVDHDHELGHVRELLCGKCNSAVAFVRDNSELALKVAEYLKRHGR